jgi:TonB family protein
MGSWSAVFLAIGLAAAQTGGFRVQVVPPTLPPEAVTGGEVLLKVTLSAVGQVRSMDVLKHSPAFTEALEAAVRRWRFGPGEGEAEERDVLVAGVFRPPTLPDVAGPAPPGAPASAPATIPFPTRWERPPYPPRAVADGVVILAVTVGEDGRVQDVVSLLSSPAFDAAAQDAAKRWAFRPAVKGGAPVESVAYLVFGFRQPAVGRRPGEKK